MLPLQKSFPVFLTTLVLIGHTALAQFEDSGTDPDRFGEPEPWVEPDFALPKFPNEDDLVEVQVEPTFTFKMYLDKSSIRIKKNITRLTYVLESKTGARNVFVEGFRCGDFHFTTYATASSDGKFYPTKNRDWYGVDKGLVHNNFRMLWLNYYACDFMRNNRTRRDLLRLVYNPVYNPDPEQQ